MEPQTLTVAVRTMQGKGAARHLRSSGQIPAVFYGPKTEPTPIAVSPRDLVKLLQNPHGRNTLLKLAIGDREELAVVKDLDVHPVTREPLHADFYQVSREQPITAKVPVRTTGRALGVQKGAEMRVFFRELPVRAKPQDVPAVIEINVAPLDMGATVTVGELALPEGVEVTLASQRNVVMISAEERKKRGPEEDEEKPAAAAAPEKKGDKK